MAIAQSYNNLISLLKNMVLNIQNVEYVKKHKIAFLIFFMIIYSFIYLLLSDKHFKGVNKFQEMLKDEVIKGKVKQEIYENFETFETTSNQKNKFFDFEDALVNQDEDTEKIIDKTTQETEKEVYKKELDPSKVTPNVFQRLFNRLYFSIITGCLLGYGDVYPVTNTCKLLTMIQSISTITLIII